MKSATAPVPATQLELLQIAIADLRPSKNNPRRIDDKHPSLPGLADSIKSHGVLEPLLVRATLEKGEIAYEILAGERRFRAARIAGVATVPCIVREVDDQAAFEITVIENLQREDLHWLEEARGVDMMVKKGWDAATIAAHIGKSTAWVSMRAKLATISPKWQKTVEDPKSDFHGWGASCLELIARFPHDVQDGLLGRDVYWLRRCSSVKQLQEEIDKNLTRLLNSAQWGLDDAKLVPKAGACSSCDKRSSCQQDLFEKNSGGDRCTDADCWSTKARAFLQRKLAEVRQLHPGIELASKSWLHREDREQYGLKENDQIENLDSGSMKAATKDEKGAKAFYVVDSGTIVWRKKQTFNSRTGDYSGSSKSKSPTADEKRKREALKIDYQRFEHIIECFDKEMNSTSECPVTMQEMVALTAAFGCGQYNYAKEAMKQLKTYAKKPIGELTDILWKDTRLTISDNLTTPYKEKPMVEIVEELCEMFEWDSKLEKWKADALKKHPPMSPAAPKKAKAKKP